MCNLYRHEIDVTAMAEVLDQAELKLDRASRTANYAPDYVGRDKDGPVVTNGDDGGSQVEFMRWGLPPIGEGKSEITNIRNLHSSYWRNIYGTTLDRASQRCLVPFSSFAEYSSEEKGNAWFDVVDEDGDPCPAFFAGVWRNVRAERLKEVEGKKRRVRTEDDWNLYAFLTTEPNETVAKVHPKAMPVILTEPAELKAWMEGGQDSLVSLQRTLPDARVRRVA